MKESTKHRTSETEIKLEGRKMKRYKNSQIYSLNYWQRVRRTTQEHVGEKERYTYKVRGIGG
uniref:Uncharacterized protein n=1 Tax=Arion vulgaris TaxID=1028688 RepID=A0A0B6YWT1_9EUPU